MMAVLVAISYTNTLGGGEDLIENGRPVVREAFSDEDYEMDIGDRELSVKFSPDVAGEYEGGFLAVYAYDGEGNHITKIKRVIYGEILIGETEPPSFVATFDGRVVKEIDNPEKSLRFLEIIRDAEENGRDFGVERCLMGKMCIAVCPAAAIKVLVRDDENKGRIIPDIDYNKCIEGGLCSSRCPTNLIVT